MYKIIVDDTVTLFFLENKINISGALKEVKNKLELFPRSYQTYKGHDNIRIIKLNGLSLLYIIDESEKKIYIKDIIFIKSKIKFKL